MYPSSYFGLFPPFPQNNRAFVAMSFDPAYNDRWNKVITPAVQSIKVNGIALEPYRVDLRAISDSILTEILDEIRKCRVFIADITSVGKLEERAVRNANVMYEVGLAHAVRLPEEVVLLRSDEEERPFDIANIRIHQYDPDNSPDVAKAFVIDTIIQSLREIDLQRNLSIINAAERLDYKSWMILAECHDSQFLHHPNPQTIRQIYESTSRAHAITRLLEIGALRTELPKITPQMVKENGESPAEHLFPYKITQFGLTLLSYGQNKMGIYSKEIKPLLDE